MVVVAISGPPGAGSSTAARLLADELDVDYFSPGQYLKERADGESESVAAKRMWEDEELGTEESHNDLDALQRRLAKDGDIVFDGKLSIHMLGDIADLTVWLDAPLEVRAQRTADRDDLSPEEVIKIIRERQQTDIEKFKEMYDFNYFEQEEEAELVIDTADVRPAAVVERILDRLD